MNKTNLSVMATLVALFLASVAATACAVDRESNSNRTTSNVKVANFQRIEASTGVKVIYTQGALSKAVVTAPSDVMERVVVKVEGGTLVAKVKPRGKSLFGFVRGRSDGDDVTVRVSAPAVGGFSASSSGEIECKAPMSVKGRVNVSVSSSGEVELGSLSATEVTTTVSSGGDISIDRLSASSLSCSVSSGGDIDVEGITCKAVKASVSSGGEVDLEGTADSLHASVSSGGEIKAEKLVVTNCTGSASSGGVIRINAATANVSTSSGGSVRNVR